ncbi:FAD binding domain-containing protein [Nonomuraea cavernae]|uniref:Carbon monoxide dehydrogenase n=1 Tax=Nonomuraea cavernae TaxID=2045107 RepID=A0A917Z545_9ACTN|nr:FAD binding domain-containing protein [Nonomuraea cavernae]MCA2187013.1 FAD binding domain-containing protein [Nonomuraea cavernae]GGO75016.1 carbon monoxide dehydrogenase [Nonomuraea cavernae]
MKPPPFEYHAPRDLGEALRILAGVRGKVLAGGQSLIPLLNMRLMAPEHLIDINRIESLATIETTPRGVTVGALARHSEVEHSGAHPLLGQALRLVAHPVIRNRGTVVGSLVHADPAAELPAVLAVLNGSVRLARDGAAAGDAPLVRDVGAAEFFTGPLESAVRPDELAVSAFFPALPARTGTAFREVARRHGDYALAGVCAVVTLDDDLRVGSARVACVGVGPVPITVDVTSECDGRPAATVDWAAVTRAVREATEPEGDIHATAAYRLRLVGVLAGQALSEAAREAAAD